MRHLKLIYCVFIWLLLGGTGCATLFNSRYQKVEVKVSEPCRVEAGGVSKYTQGPENTAVVRVLRRKESLPLVVVRQDSTREEFVLPSQVSPTVWFNLGFGFTGLGGVAIDMLSSKRFAYQNPVTIDLVNHRLKRGYWALPQKGQTMIGMGLALPHVQFVHWSQQKDNTAGPNIGFSLSVDRGIAHGRTLWAKTGFANNGPVAKALFFSVGQRHWRNRIQAGYGLGYTVFMRELVDPNVFFGTEPNELLTLQGIGPALNLGLRLRRGFFLQLDYQMLALQTNLPKKVWNGSAFFALELACKFGE